MLSVGGERRRGAAALQGFQHCVDFSRGEYLLLKRLDIADKADALSYVGRHLVFVGATADEGDDRVQVLGG